MTDPNVATDADRAEFDAWIAEKRAKEAAEKAAAEAAAALAAAGIDADTPMIVHNETYMEGSVQMTRQHGPMPVSEWAEYERKNRL